MHGWPWPAGRCLYRNGYTVRYPGHGPWYEVWFGKLDIAPGRAFWFRYTLLDGKTREMAVWAILFDGAVTVGKSSQTWVGREPVAPGLAFAAGDSHLAPGVARGCAGDLAWRLTWTGAGGGFHHVPPILRCLPGTGGYLTLDLDARISGIIEAPGGTVGLDHVTGMLGHIWGRRQPCSWAWLHCNHFDNQPDIAVEALSVVMPAGRGKTPAITSLIIKDHDRRRVVRGVLAGLALSSSWNRERWTAAAWNDRHDIRLTVKRREDMPYALVTYQDTDGSSLWCRNSKLADLEVSIHDKEHDRRSSWRASARAAFETVDRMRPERTPDL
ncbi:hypothetical protein JW905_16440 [bacterium]|nr:hypothetical protein [candidate division CSSED10-310 bacterium]